MTAKEIKKELLRMQDKTYQQFSQNLLPGVSTILGVRLPYLRLLSKRIAKENPISYLERNDLETFEEVMLQGMVIGTLSDFSMVCFYTQRYVYKIDNWSICDSFCTSLKITKKYPQDMWKFLCPYWKSEKTYFLRFACVMSLLYFIDDKHIDSILQNILAIKNHEYYVSMAVSWLLSIAYKKYPLKIKEFLTRDELSRFVVQKTIQKIKELRGTSAEEKKQLERLKR